MSDLEHIIRLGIGVEVCVVYEAVAALCECRDPSRRLELISALESAYRACECEYQRVDGLIETYRASDGAPSAITGKGGWRK